MAAAATEVACVRASVSRRRLSIQLARAAVLASVLPIGLATLLSLFQLSDNALFELLLFWLACWLLVPALLLGSLFAGRERALPGTLKIGEHELLVGGPQWTRVPRSSIVGGTVVYERGGFVVELSLGNGSVVRIATEDEAAAPRLLSALGVGGKGRTVAYELGARWPALRATAALFTGGLVTMIAAGFLGLADALSHALTGSLVLRLVGLVFVLSSLYAAAKRAPNRVVIGVDGVVLEGTRRRFIPHSKIEAILPTPDGVYLVMAGSQFGKRVVLATERGPRSDALVNALRAATDRASTGAAASDNLNLLDRGNRSLSQWRDALARLSTGSGDYRNASLDRDTLVGAASDAGSSRSRRLAAAIALSHSADAEAIERVRVAVNSLADDRVRVALAGALDGKLDDEALAQALAEDEYGPLRA